GAANKSFLLELLDQPEVIDASADTGWIDRVRAEGRLRSHRHAGVALAAAAIEEYHAAELAERQQLLRSARGGKPDVQHDAGEPVELKLRGQSYRMRVAHTAPSRYRVGIVAGTVNQSADVEIHRYGDGAATSARLTVNGQVYRVITSTHGPAHLVEVDGVTHRISRDEGGMLRAPAP